MTSMIQIQRNRKKQISIITMHSLLFQAEPYISLPDTYVNGIIPAPPLHAPKIVNAGKPGQGQV